MQGMWHTAPPPSRWRRASPWLAAAGVLVAAGLAAALGSQRAVAGAEGAVAAPSDPPPAAAAPPDRAGFAQRCEATLAQRSGTESLRGCAPFFDDARLAGAAHAVVGTAYMLGEQCNPAASAEHATLAAQAGDPVGQFALAYHALRGTPGVPYDEARIRQLLEQARASKVERAGVLLQTLEQASSCRTGAALRLMDAPVFCMPRAQLQGLLRLRGLRTFDSVGESRSDWRETWLTGGTPAGASQLEVNYDRDPETELMWPATLAYRFDSPMADRTQGERLHRALAAKYGEMAGNRWTLADGVHIELRALPSGGHEVRYELPRRLATAREHALLREAEARREQLRRLAEAL